MKHYVLDGHKVRKATYHEWIKMWNDPESRRVAKTQVGNLFVSTVFLGIDHGMPGGPPQWFETMVFGGDAEDDCWRYETWDRAVAGHAAVVKGLAGGA